jgi:hypothetical protein
MLREMRTNFGPVPLTRSLSKVRSLRCNTAAASRCVNSVMRHLQTRLSEEANPVTGGRMAQLPYTSERAVCLTSPKSGQGRNALHYPLCASLTH